MKIVLDDKIPYIAPGLEALRRELALRGTPLKVVAMAGAAIDHVAVRDADILIVRTRTRCDAALLADSRVRLVVTATIGYDHLDTAWLESAGITWTNCPGCNATSVAQYVASCLLLLERERGMVPASLAVGIVGVGHVGQAVAARLRHLGVGRLLLCDPPREERGESLSETPASQWSSLEEVLRTCDVVTLHTPLTRAGRHATWHILDAEAFATMAQGQQERHGGGTVVINAARGGVIDEAALEAAMDAGIVREAIIDTWEDEPRVRRTLLERAYLATPHIAGYSADGKANATRMSLEAVARHLGLAMTFEVTPPRLEMPPGMSDAGEAATALYLYDPSTDSARLKAKPDSFEWQRGHYPLRREHFG